MSSSEDMLGDTRPVVPTGRGGNIGLYVFLAILMLGGMWVFSALRSGADQIAIPMTTPDPSLGSNRIAAPPPLVLPPLSDMAGTEQRQQLAQSVPAPTTPLAPQVIIREVQVPVPAEPQREPATTAEPAAPAVVFDNRRDLAPPTLPSEEGNQERVTASRLANPSTTVPQGTVIPAVLETAFDSTRPGAVRALVQRDIHSFDGSRVLIPRGSRLFGTYEAGINPGERRALITWTRLIRPDGVTIALNSPASDPLGRAGVEGDVNSRFFARFGGAILQSVLDIGVGVATRQAGDGVFVALPGSTQNVTQQSQQNQARPVLEIDHGTSVSVFVARDLDFSTVEN